MSLLLDVPPVVGVQTPAIQHLPEGITGSSGAEYLEFAASCGYQPDEWQKHHVNVAVAERAGGRWACTEYADVDPRQNGKGGIIEILKAGFLFVDRMPLVIYTAHEFKTASESFLRFKQWIDGSDELTRMVNKVWTAHGSEGFELTAKAGGGRLRYLARSAGSGRGFTAPALFFDEAFKLSAEVMAALFPTLSAQPNPWIGYFSSAAKSDSTQLHKLRRRALAGDGPRLGYLEHSVDPDDYGGRDSDGWREARRRPEVWAIANPALGIRITADFVQVELDTLDAETFDRERLGVPDPEPAAGDPVVDVDEFLACADRSSELEGSPTFVVDVSPGQQSAAIAVVGVRADGLPHVELVDHRRGTDWVAGRRDELEAAHSPLGWVRDPSGPAVELEGEWRDLTARESTEACARLLPAVRDRQFRWVCDDRLAPALMAAVLGGRKQAQGDGNWRWSRKGSHVDISPLVALTVALRSLGLVDATAEPFMVWG